MPFTPTLDETGACQRTTAAPAVLDVIDETPIGDKILIESSLKNVMIRLSKIGDRLKQLDESRWSRKTPNNPLDSSSALKTERLSWQQGQTDQQAYDMPKGLSPKSSTTPVLASAASSSLAVPPSRSPTLSFTPTVPFPSNERPDLKMSYGEPSEEECEQESSTIEKIISRITNIGLHNYSLLSSGESRDSSRSRSEYVENKEQEHVGVSRSYAYQEAIESITRRSVARRPLNPVIQRKNFIQQEETHSDLQERPLPHRNEGLRCPVSPTPSTVITVGSNIACIRSQFADLANIPEPRSVLRVQSRTGETIKEKLLTQSDRPDHFQAHVYFSYKRAGDIVPNLVLHLPKSWTFLKLVRKSLAVIQRKTSEEDARTILWVFRYHPNQNLKKIRENIRVIFGEKGVSFRGSNLKKEIGPYLTKFINKFWLQERRY